MWTVKWVAKGKHFHSTTAYHVMTSLSGTTKTNWNKQLKMQQSALTYSTKCFLGTRLYN